MIQREREGEKGVKKGDRRREKRNRELELKV